MYFAIVLSNLQSRVLFWLMHFKIWQAHLNSNTIRDHFFSPFLSKKEKARESERERGVDP